MAKGGAEVPENPWIAQDLDAHDSDNEVHQGDTTQPFQPGSSSMPYHGGEAHVLTHLHETGRLPDVPEMCIDENILCLLGDENV